MWGKKNLNLHPSSHWKMVNPKKRMDNPLGRDNTPRITKIVQNQRTDMTKDYLMMFVVCEEIPSMNGLGNGIFHKGWNRQESIVQSVKKSFPSFLIIHTFPGSRWLKIPTLYSSRRFSHWRCLFLSVWQFHHNGPCAKKKTCSRRRPCRLRKMKLESIGQKWKCTVRRQRPATGLRGELSPPVVSQTNCSLLQFSIEQRGQKVAPCEANQYRVLYRMRSEKSANARLKHAELRVYMPPLPQTAKPTAKNCRTPKFTRALGKQSISLITVSYGVSKALLTIYPPPPLFDLLQSSSSSSPP